MGVILIAMGVYGMASVWAEMFGRGPGEKQKVRAGAASSLTHSSAWPHSTGFGVVSVGVCVILTAILGLLGMKYDNKCMLLLVRPITSDALRQLLY